MKTTAAAVANSAAANLSLAEDNVGAYESEAALKSYAHHDELRPVETRLFNRHFDTRYPVLDLGCGCGRTSAGLVRLGYNVTGVDLSQSFVETARKNVPKATFIHADVRELPVPDASFEQVLFSFNGLDCVHPIAELRRALVEIRRVLKPGGVFIYSGHNIFGRFGRHLLSFSSFWTGLREHPGYLWLQRRGSQIGQWYWRYDHSYGELVLYSAPPSVHLRTQRELGFETLEVSGNDPGRSRWWLTCFEHHVHYVVRKP